MGRCVPEAVVHPDYARAALWGRCAGFCESWQTVRITHAGSRRHPHQAMYGEALIAANTDPSQAPEVPLRYKGQI